MTIPVINPAIIGLIFEELEDIFIIWINNF